MKQLVKYLLMALIIIIGFIIFFTLFGYYVVPYLDLITDKFGFWYDSLQEGTLLKTFVDVSFFFVILSLGAVLYFVYAFIMHSDYFYDS